MNVFWKGLIIGLVVGGSLGIIIMAALAAGAAADRCNREGG